MPFLLSDLLVQSSFLYPEKDAVSYESDKLTYAELKVCTDRVTGSLLQAGLQRGDRVGIYTSKSVRTVAAILGVLQAGGVYVPIDPASPTSRTSAICVNCRISFLLTRTSFVPVLKTVMVGNPFLHWIGFLDDESTDDAASLPVTSQCWNTFSLSPYSFRSNAVESDLAYIFNTSGSTGTPKGVMITHRNALSFVEWAISTFSVSAQDRLSNHAPFHFDLSIFDIFVSLACGATLVLVPQKIVAFPHELVKWLEKERITIWYSVPSILKMMLQHGKIAEADLSCLRLVLFAGEVFSVKYLRVLVEMLSDTQFCNLYGPTETNVCTYYRVPHDTQVLTQEIPIGQACEHSDVFAVREDDSIVREIGEIGELHVRGATVMRGYWDNEELTRQVLSVASLASSPIYRTGDIVRLRPDGLWDFLGRRDHLVKSRGYRIELGEVEVALHRHPEIEQAIVIPLPDEQIGNRLVACLVSILGKELRPEDVRRYCAQLLPHYMVPEQIHIYLSLPLTSTGKVDRTLLRSQLLAQDV